jgi:hypothetical protein
MGRFYLPPHVLAAVAVLAAIGVVLLLLARPAAGHPTMVSPGMLAPEPPAPGFERARAGAFGLHPGHEIARPRRGATIVVRARPRGAVVARVGATTEFGSPTTLAVAKRRGHWLGVITTHVGNGRLGWVNEARSRLRISHTRVVLKLDLSARRLVVRRGGKVLRRITVGVGRPSSPTPVGRFAVTDKLPGARYSSAYGCCILALSARQTSLPAGWRGGDRIAIHGTNDPSSIGAASSAGCPHASAADMRFLFRVVPLGAPVVVRP